MSGVPGADAGGVACRSNWGTENDAFRIRTKKRENPPTPATTLG